MFPGDLLPHNYPNPDNPDQLLGRTEVQRREEYIDQLHTQLGGEEHPLAQLVKQCLQNSPSRKPSAEEVLGQLEEMRAQIQDPHEQLTKLEMMRLLTEMEGELREKDNQLRVNESEKQHLQQQLRGQQEQLDVSGNILRT